MRYLTPKKHATMRCPAFRTHSLAVCLALWMLIAGAGCADQMPARQAQALERLPHDPSAFTEGLLIDHGVLYESTGNYGHSELRRVDLASGRVLATHRLPDRYFGEGLARYNGRLYQLTWKSGTGFVYDADTLALVGRFHYAGEGWGLTRCGDTLAMSNGSAELAFVDPADFTVRRRVQVTDRGRPVPHLNELETIDGRIWANVWLTDDIVQIDPATGHVVRRIRATNLAEAMPDSADVLNGIAYDAATGQVYITGKYWPTLFHIARPDTAGRNAQNASAEARCQSR